VGITAHMPALKAPARHVPRSRLFPLIAVTVSTFVFTVLLILVRTQWSPLESVDHSLATALNNLVADRPTALSVLRAITWMGSNTVLWTLVVAGLIVLGVRRRLRLAIFLAIAGIGALTLDPILKTLVGRLRPVVVHPIAHGVGNSFPSGHALGSIVCYGALILVFLPAIPQRARKPVTIIVAVLVTAIGVSRIMLGVHYLSDVLGAWALGVAWLGLTAYAFEIMRSQSGQPVTKPLTEGLEPEAASDLKPAVPDRRAGPPHPARVGAVVIVAWIVILGAVVGFGELVTRYGGANIAGDHTIPHWLASHRTPTLTRLSALFSTLGATQMILAVTVLTAVVALAVTRRWRPVVFVVLVMLGEVGLFVTAEAIVKRPRPDVVHLETHLPTSSYPSGHVAATICIYTAIAILVLGHTRRWWRWPFLALAVLMPILVATGRMYRGMHHPTDVIGSIILAGLLLTAMYWAIRPNAAAPSRSTRPATQQPADPGAAPSVAMSDHDDRPSVQAADDGVPATAQHG
jgi:undecaprenyl-diphosphatase